MLDLELSRRILAHRGVWERASEQNTIAAIALAFEMGFGVELDVRDHNGSLVVSHDPPEEAKAPESFSKVLELPSHGGILAINVKSDGLSSMFPSIAREHFFFDMSAPEAMKYSDANLTIARRVSDLEPISSGDIRESKYLWVDSFYRDWFASDDQLFCLDRADKLKVIVSPELHGRPYSQAWEFLVELFRSRADVAICTDYPSHFLRRVNEA